MSNRSWFRSILACSFLSFAALYGCAADDGAASSDDEMNAAKFATVSIDDALEPAVATIRAKFPNAPIFAPGDVPGQPGKVFLTTDAEVFGGAKQWGITVGSKKDCKVTACASATIIGSNEHPALHPNGKVEVDGKSIDYQFLTITGESPGGGVKNKSIITWKPEPSGAWFLSIGLTEAATEQTLKSLLVSAIEAGDRGRSSGGDAGASSSGDSGASTGSDASAGASSSGDSGASTGSDASAGAICTPGADVYCRCADRSTGTKECSADGKSFSACVCAK